MANRAIARQVEAGRVCAGGLVDERISIGIVLATGGGSGRMNARLMPGRQIQSLPGLSAERHYGSQRSLQRQRRHD